MGKSQKTKGAVYERDVVNVLKASGFDVSRNLDQTRDGGGDIICPPYLFECKRRAAIAVYQWFEQAEKAANPLNLVPVVVARADHKESLCMLRLVDFLALVGRAH